MSPTSQIQKYEQDGEEAKEIAKYLPYFPFKGIPRFYDIGKQTCELSMMCVCVWRWLLFTPH